VDEKNDATSTPTGSYAYGPNRELYEKLSTPYENKEKASTALQAFLDAVAEARKVHGVADVLVVAVAFHNSSRKAGDALANMLSLGDARNKAQLAAMAFQEYASPEIERARKLVSVVGGTLGDEEGRD